MQGDVIAALEQLHHLTGCALELAKGPACEDGIQMCCEMQEEDLAMANDRLENALEHHSAGRLHRLRAVPG
jgi:hypothetical protein